MTKSMAYKQTSVPIERSQKHIRDLLYKYGAGGIQFTEEFKERMVRTRFMYEMNGQDKGRIVYFVRIEAKVPEVKESRRGRRATISVKQEQANRAAWRAMFYALKSRMESIDYGIETFEQAFLAHFEAGVDEHGNSLTIGQRIIPRLRAGQLALPSQTERQ